MDERVKMIFDRNPKQEEVYQIIGSNRYFKQKDNALAAMEGNAGDLKTHKRGDYYPSEKEAGSKKLEVGSKKAVVKKAATKKATPKKPAGFVPEGEPSEAWTVPQLKAYMKRGGIAFVTRDKEADLLKKIAEHKQPEA